MRSEVVVLLMILHFCDHVGLAYTAFMPIVASVVYFNNKMVYLHCILLCTYCLSKKCVLINPCGLQTVPSQWRGALVTAIHNGAVLFTFVKVSQVGLCFLCGRPLDIIHFDVQHTV